jgi:hypothetical protein
LRLPEVVNFGTKVDKNAASKVEIYQVNAFGETGEDSKEKRLRDSTPALARPGSDVMPTNSNRVEALTRLEQFLKSEEDSKEADLFARLEHALQKREAKSGRVPPKQKDKPIRFKDAVERKFGFPFNLCMTWAMNFVQILP